MRFCSSIFAKCILLFSSLRNSKTYLPKLSIPVERRELGDGWVLTCHGQNGGDLTLSDVKIKRKNIVCQVLGGDSLFLPLFDAIDDTDKSVAGSVGSLTSAGGAPEDHEEIEHMEQSILDHIKDMILQAQRHGCWTVGIGGVGHVSYRVYYCLCFFAWSVHLCFSRTFGRFPCSIPRIPTWTQFCMDSLWPLSWIALLNYGATWSCPTTSY